MPSLKDRIIIEARRAAEEARRRAALSASGGGGGTPDPHAASHENGGGDEIDVTGLSGVLADPQTAASHTHPQSQITDLVTDLAAKQPLDSDLTAIAALTTTAFGRGLLELANAAALLAAAGAAAASHTHAQADVTNLVSDLAGKQPLDSDLTSIAALTTTSFGRSLLELANAAALLSAAGAAAASHTHAQADVTNLTTDLAAKQPLDSTLTTIAALNEGVIIADQTIFFAGLSGTATFTPLTDAGKQLIDDASASAQRTTLGVGTGDSPEFAGINIGHASDTTLRRSSAGNLEVEGNALYRAGGTDVPVADGGTGASTAQNARLNILPTVSGNSLKVLRVNVGETDYELTTLAGGGDMLAANNLSDVANAATSFGNIKQAATTTATGVVELATDGETASGVVVQGNDARLVWPKGYLYGLGMSNAADANNDITIAAGQCVSDDGTTNMVLSASITKQLDAAWAVGTNQGGINTGSEAADTWYEVHLIMRTDTGVVDVMFTTTANRATLPASYTKKRRIGWIRNDGSSNIKAFTQVDDHFTWTTAVNDVNGSANATAQTQTLTAPPSSIARIRAWCLGNTAINQANAVVVSELSETDTAPTTANGHGTMGSGDFAIIGAGHIEMRLNSSSQLRDRSITATGTMTYILRTFGFIDHRGKMSNM